MSNKSHKRVSVLHLTIGLGIGGAEQVIYDLVVNNDNEKVDLYVKSMLKNSKASLSKFQQAGIDTEVLGVTKNPLTLIRAMVKLHHAINDHKIKILHAHMFHAFILAFFVKITQPKIKIVFTYHASGMKSYIRECILFLLSPMRDVDIIFSEKSKEYFTKDQYKVIPNGIDVEKYKKTESKFDKFTFISVARLEDSKNHKALVDICKKLAAYEFQILIAGQGYLEVELKELVRANQLEEKINFLGVRHDIPELLAKSHVFLLPSIREGLPIVLLEAGASAMPIISTNVGSIPLLLDKNNSFMSDIEDFPKYMIKTMEDYDIAHKKGKALREKVYNEFSIDKVSQDHETIYLDLNNGK